MNIFISIVIPIYNVGPYLTKCLDSVISQTYDSYEVILINDGSTDGSEKIAEKYCDNHSKFHLYSQKNQGLAAARNAGIARAKGDYICFLDSDDYYEPHYLEKMISEVVKNGSDMVICDYYEVTVEGNKKDVYEICPYIDGVVDKNCFYEALTKVGSNHFATAVVVAWNKLIRTDIVKNNLYPVDKLHEDEFVIFDLLSSCDRISWISDPLYAYVTRGEGIMHTLSDEALIKRLNVLDAYAERIERANIVVVDLTEEFWKAYYENAKLYLSWFCSESASAAHDIKRIVVHHYFMTWKKSGKYLLLKNRIKYFLKGVKNLVFYR